VKKSDVLIFLGSTFLALGLVFFAYQGDTEEFVLVVILVSYICHQWWELLG
jgi:hypothetical protein